MNKNNFNKNNLSIYQKDVSQKEFDQYLYELEQKELEKKFLEDNPNSNYKIGDEVSLISTKNKKIINLFNIYTDDKYFKEFLNLKSNSPRNLIISEIEYDRYFDQIIQRLYFTMNVSIPINYRNSIYYEKSRRKKIKNLLEDFKKDE